MVNSQHISAIIDVPTQLQQLITSEQAWHYRIIPAKADGRNWELLIDDESLSDEIAFELSIQFDREIKLIPTPSDDIQRALSSYYRKSLGGAKSVAVLSANSQQNFVESLIMQAKELGSSDIHIEIYDEKARVRMRIDGTLVERFEVEKKDYPALVNRIKIKANLDIAEKRLPQDGRIEYKEHGEDFDIRVSVIPTLYGEKMVLRLLNRDATDIQLATLGMKEDQLATYHEGIKKPHGIVLISGPTGSGKTTTLYATLKLLNEERRNIMTVEDPIEYTLEGVNQVQLKEAIGLSFAATLRSFLRQDPDVIMLGEIRDAETAEMAVRAALTGHLVLSTIHTNSAWGTVNRLIDMGVPPFLLANTLNTSVAQRLVRKLCQECAKDDSFNPDLFPSGFTPVRKLESHKVARGCDDCYYTGYSGRAAIYEIIPIDRELTEAVKDSHFSVAELLADRKLSTLADNAFELLASGITSIDEVYPLLITH